MKKNKKLIPKGWYCYTLEEGQKFTNRKPCIYWKYVSPYNAYCGYLEKDDIELAKAKQFIDVKTNNFKRTGKVRVTMKVGGSLLFDQCKECNVNMKY